MNEKNINIKMNTIKYNCNKCKDTGQIKFKTIDEVNEYQQDIKIANEKKAAGL